MGSTNPKNIHKNQAGTCYNRSSLCFLFVPFCTCRKEKPTTIVVNILKAGKLRTISRRRRPCVFAKKRARISSRTPLSLFPFFHRKEEKTNRKKWPTQHPKGGGGREGRFRVPCEIRERCAGAFRLVWSRCSTAVTTYWCELQSTAGHCTDTHRWGDTNPNPTSEILFRSSGLALLPGCNFLRRKLTVRAWLMSSNSDTDRIHIYICILCIQPHVTSVYDHHHRRETTWSQVHARYTQIFWGPPSALRCWAQRRQHAKRDSRNGF